MHRHLLVCAVAPLLVQLTALGATLTVAICWMGAWDEMAPSPDGLPAWSYVDDPAQLCLGESGEDRPLLLGIWSSITPTSWSAGQRVWADDTAVPVDGEAHAFSGFAADDRGQVLHVTWRPGPGLSSSFCIERVQHIEVPTGSAANAQPTLSSGWSARYGDRPESLGPEGPIPAALAGHLPGELTALRTNGRWPGDAVPSWATLDHAAPDRDAQQWLLAPTEPQVPDSATAGSAERPAVGVSVEEVRAYGWPLRCMTVRGWREDLEWHDLNGFVRDETCAWWSDGIGARAPLIDPASWQLSLPATGLPGHVLWGPLFANVLLLGAPAIALWRLARHIVRRVRYSTPE